MIEWSEERIAWYYRATRESEYPRLMVEKIRPYLKPEAKVLDLGSGPGAFALALAPFCREVIALDQNREVLAALEAELRKRGITNVRVITGVWPLVETEPVDVTVSAYTGESVVVELSGVEAILKKTREHVFLICPATNERSSLVAAERPERRWNSNFKDTLAALATLKVKAEVELHECDFSQPVFTREEAARFIAWQLDLSLKEAEKVAERRVCERKGRLYVPIKKKTALIHIGLKEQ